MMKLPVWVIPLLIAGCTHKNEDYLSRLTIVMDAHTITNFSLGKLVEIQFIASGEIDRMERTLTDVSGRPARDAFESGQAELEVIFPRSFIGSVRITIRFLAPDGLAFATGEGTVRLPQNEDEKIHISMRLLAPTCSNGMQDEDVVMESDVDCGGLCSSCAIGKRCKSPADCDTGWCSERFICERMPIPDMAIVDLGPDLTGDMTSLPDFGPDATRLPDMSDLPDLVEIPDKAVPVDQAEVPDMTMLKDQSVIPDKAVPKDLTDVPDQASNLAPVISSIEPASGPSTGNTALIIHGMGFLPGATVTVAGKPAGNVIVVAEDRITAITPATPGLFGKLIIQVTNPNGKAAQSTFFTWIGSVQFANAVAYPSLGGGTHHVLVADLNADGAQDLVASNYLGNNIAVFLGVGDGTYPAGQAYAPVSRATETRAADLDGDAKMDLVAASLAGDYVTPFFGDGSGKLALAQNIALPLMNPRSLVIADFNEDGKPDIVTANNAGNSVSIITNMGQRIFIAGMPVPVGMAPMRMVGGDLNGDNRVDLVVTSNSGNSITVLLALGGGLVKAQPQIAVGMLPDGLVLGDWNQDKKLDVMTANLGSNDASRLQGNGDGTFQAAVATPVGNTARYPAVADVNLDGKQDLFVVCSATNVVYMFLGKGDGTFEKPTSFSTGGTTPFSIEAADLNKDGLVDLAIANRGTSTIVVYLNVSQ